MKKVRLNNGMEMPRIGLGVFQVDGNTCEKAVSSALALGYRHIDSAHHYFNEAAVGKAVRESSTARSEIWVTSKIWPNEYEDETAVDRMLDRFGLDYLDLVILHQQVGNYLAGYHNLEKAYEAGKIRAIGLSNFESERLEDVLSHAEVKPQILQVECHPYFQQWDLQKRIDPYGMKMECWYPLGHGDAGLLNEPVLVSIAEKYHKSTAQIILKWHVMEGRIPLPKSTNPVHQKENIDLFDFTLTDGEIKQIEALDCGRRYWHMTLAQQEEKFLNIHLD